MLKKLANYARTRKLSDLHIHSNKPVAIRVHGDIEKISDDIISDSDINNFLQENLDNEQKIFFEKNKQVDFAVASDDLRFRVNAYLTATGPALVLRKIETEIPPIEKLGLPQAMLDIVNADNGLVLVTGPTGSGKSTSLASLVNEINKTRPGNIITVEDPIEFVHTSQKCIVSQREIGRDAVSFAHALKAMLREDPDFILLGEMRDMETISLALTAAETGHLVFGTLHTNGAANSINRIIDVFPSEQQAQIRSQLSQSLRLVVTQTLLKRADGMGRTAAFEVMVNTPAISNLIRENKIFQIDQALQTGRAYGMMTMEDSLKKLISMGIISEDAV
ncbi:MAG: type IV pilus twitching motility protein PilT [Rickettsiales bacterium]|nr:type IV pilus twitching motility protein PilT [Rickettsiales bacterium]